MPTEKSSTASPCTSQGIKRVYTLQLTSYRAGVCVMIVTAMNGLEARRIAHLETGLSDWEDPIRATIVDISELVEKGFDVVYRAAFRIG